MLAKMSKWLTSFYVQKNALEKDEIEAYNYCFEILISTIINLVCIIVVGFLCQKYLETVLFIAIFMILRDFGGGFHAHTHLGCFCTIISIFGIMIGLTYLPLTVLMFIGIPFQCISIVTIIFMTPIDCSNKRIDISSRKRLRKRMWLIMVTITLINSILWIFVTFRIIAFTIAYTCFSVALLMIIGAIKNMIYTRKMAK